MNKRYFGNKSFKKRPDQARHRENKLVYPLPRDTAAQINIQHQNLGLLFDKFIPFQQWSFEEKDKKKFLDQVIKVGENNAIKNEIDIVLETCQSRLRSLTESYKKKGFEIASTKMKVVWRMVVGLGSASVLETSMTLHPIYGFPFIPGSALKGITHAYAKLKNFERIDEVFGTQNQKGKVIFFDAYPEKFPLLELDIMNVHYSDYYDKNKPPADWQNPCPVYFLTVGKNTVFSFYLASKNTELLEQANKLLTDALNEWGVGAKTRVGYGYMKLYEISDESHG